jgi:TPR repeat protein
LLIGCAHGPRKCSAPGFGKIDCGAADAYNRGREAVKARDFSTAEQYFTTAIGLEPKWTQANFQRAGSRYLQGKLDSAITDYQYAAERGLPEAMLFAAQLYWERNKAPGRTTKQREYDAVKAMCWYCRAGEGGDESALRVLRSLEIEGGWQSMCKKLKSCR